MKIDSFEAWSVDLPLGHGYRITGTTINEVQNHLVRVRSGQLEGVGSASPSGRVMGEDDSHCIAAMRGVLRDLTLGFDLVDDAEAWSRLAFEQVPEAPAARAAVDMALWDLLAKKASQPLVRFWGGNPHPVPTSVTIGICSVEQTLAEAKEWLQQGFVVLKIKIGEDLDADVERLRQLRELAGPDILIRVDANQGYDLEGSRELLKKTAELDIEMFEQPIEKTDLSGMSALTSDSDIPIVADESAGSIEQCVDVIERRAAHVVNIKLMKCGGPTAARFIHDMAFGNGLGLMLGCNDETRISIAAGVHLAQSMPGLRYADLDGHMDLQNDPSSGGFTIRDGLMYLDDSPGLGVSLGS